MIWTLLQAPLKVPFSEVCTILSLWPTRLRRNRFPRLSSRCMYADCIQWRYWSCFADQFCANLRASAAFKFRANFGKHRQLLGFHSVFPGFGKHCELSSYRSIAPFTAFACFPVNITPQPLVAFRAFRSQSPFAVGLLSHRAMCNWSRFTSTFDQRCQQSGTVRIQCSLVRANFAPGLVQRTIFMHQCGISLDQCRLNT